jgi:hypothetical protein
MEQLGDLRKVVLARLLLESAGLATEWWKVREGVQTNFADPEPVLL